MDIGNLTIIEASKLLKDKKLTVKDLVYFFVDRARDLNDKHNIYLEIFDDIDEQIEVAQKSIDAGEGTELTGIPISIKDNILIEGRKCSAASKILENYTATYNSTVAQKLIDKGVVFIGRVNMDEFAMGSSTENSAFGVTKNAYDTERVAGGSSGGSAVSVATKTAMASFGSDTGGSIRQPASLNGIVGLKPTYGSVSRYGLIAMASSLDIIGPLTNNVSDSEILFNAISGKDSNDSTTVDKTDLEREVSDGVKKIGVPKGVLEDLDQDSVRVFNGSIEKLQKENYEIVEIDLEHLKNALAVYYVLQPAEVSSNMARYDGVKYGGKVDGENLIDDYFKTRGQLLGSEVKRRIILGTYMLSAGYSDQYYNRANILRNTIKDELLKSFNNVDVIALPTTPGPAFKIGEKSDPLQLYLEDIFTVFANLTGVPAISVPNGEVDGLPLGIQFVAPHLGEQRLFEVAKKFETIK